MVAGTTLTKSRAARENAEAHSAAHKLAGTLGTFKLMRGTVLARDLEHAELQRSNDDPDCGVRHPRITSAIAAKLRAVIEERKSGQA